jgi:hypothetical protein
MIGARICGFRGELRPLVPDLLFRRPHRRLPRRQDAGALLKLCGQLALHFHEAPPVGFLVRIQPRLMMLPSFAKRSVGGERLFGCSVGFVGCGRELIEALTCRDRVGDSPKQVGEHFEFGRHESYSYQGAKM